MKELDSAVEQLRRNPGKPVIAQLPDMKIEIRAIDRPREGKTAAEVFAALGPWEGESADELREILRARRAQNRPVADL